MTADWYSYPSNYSNGSSVNGFGDFIIYSSSLVGDWLGTGFLVIIFLFSFGIGMMSGSKRALMVSGFITFCFSIYFLRLNLINPLITIGLLVLTIIGGILSYNEP